MDKPRPPTLDPQIIAGAGPSNSTATDRPDNPVAANDAARRHLIQHASTIAVLMRHSAGLVVAIAVLAVPHATASPVGKALLVVLGGWAVYRLATRSQSVVYTGIDYTFTLAICLTIPMLVSGPQFHTTNSAPIAIAGTAVISFSVSQPARRSLPMAASIALAYAYGSATVVGWAHVGEIFNLYYFGLQWITSALIRLMVLRVADAVDAARRQRQGAEIAEQVNAAVRDYDREQLRLLHDTVASTLLLVGQGTPLPPDRLAAQARRDLNVLGEPRGAPFPSRIELLATLHEAALNLHTPQRWTGLDRLWLDGHIAHLVAAAAREAMNNVDRHADASIVTNDVAADRVTITDDGRGFDPATPSRRTGIGESICDRMDRIAGSATISSAPNRGTMIELRWPTTQQCQEATQRIGDPDRLIALTRMGYALALTAYAIANLAAMAGQAATHMEQPTAQLMLALIAAAVTVAAVPAILNRVWFSAWPPALILLTAAVAQTALLTANELGTQAQWSQGAIGWCLLPHLLRLNVRRASALLVLAWVVPAAYALIREPSASSALNIGLGTASILCVQLFALLFNELIRDGAEKAHADTLARMQSVARERIRDAVHTEYRRRYSKLLANIYPLLATLADATPVDARLRRRAQAESRTLRALFDQPATFDHPLLHALRSPIDNAADSGVDVSIDVNGQLPDIANDDAARITAHLTRALSATRASARITVTADGKRLTASIVCRGLTNRTALAEYSAIGEDDLELTTADDTAWLTIRHYLKGRYRDGSTVEPYL